jgi:hypothetical protein
MTHEEILLRPSWWFLVQLSFLSMNFESLVGFGLCLHHVCHYHFSVDFVALV